MPRIFSVPLVEQAREVYIFLKTTATISKLNDLKYLEKVIAEYAYFIAALKKHLQSKNSEPLIPSLEGMHLIPSELSSLLKWSVEVVWFTHMLQSAEYEIFARQNSVHGVPHTWTLCLRKEQRNKFITACAPPLPGSTYTDLPFQRPPPSQRASWRASLVTTPRRSTRTPVSSSLPSRSHLTEPGLANSSSPPRVHTEISLLFDTVWHFGQVSTSHAVASYSTHCLATNAFCTSLPSTRSS